MPEMKTGEQPQGIDPVTLQKGSVVSPDSTGKTINISGKSFEVNADIAQAFDEFTTSVDRRFGERSEELGALRQYKSSNEQQVIEKPPGQTNEVDMGTLMYENPDKFVSEFDKKIAASEKRMTSQYQAAEKSKKDEASFWDSMWAENKDLALIKSQSRDVIRLVGEKYKDLNLQDTLEVRTALAKETREWLRAVSGNNTEPDSDGYLTDSSGVSTIPKPVVKEQSRMSTREILETRKAAKRNAMQTRS